MGLKGDTYSVCSTKWNEWKTWSCTNGESGWCSGHHSHLSSEFQLNSAWLKAFFRCFSFLPQKIKIHASMGTYSIGITSDISFKLVNSNCYYNLYQHWCEKIHLLLSLLLQNFQFLFHRSFCLFYTFLTLVRRVDNTLWTPAGESNIRPLIMDGRKPMESRSIQILHNE